MAFDLCPPLVLETGCETISVRFLEEEVEITSLMAEGYCWHRDVLGDAATCEMLTAKVHAQLCCRNLGLR